MSSANVTRPIGLTCNPVAPRPTNENQVVPPKRSTGLSGVIHHFDADNKIRKPAPVEKSAINKLRKNRPVENEQLPVPNPPVRRRNEAFKWISYGEITKNGPTGVVKDICTTLSQHWDDVDQIVGKDTRNPPEEEEPSKEYGKGKKIVMKMKSKMKSKIATIATTMRMQKEKQDVQQAGPEKEKELIRVTLHKRCDYERCVPPGIVIRSVAEVVEHGLETTGIYREDPKKAKDVRREMIHQDNWRYYDFTGKPDDSSHGKMYGAIAKQSLRHLTDPLIPYCLQKSLLDSTIVKELRKKGSEVHENGLVQTILENPTYLNPFRSVLRVLRAYSEIYYFTLWFIIEHLYDVASNVEGNKMNAQSLGKVWAPAIFGDEMISNISSISRLQSNIKQKCFSNTPDVKSAPQGLINADTQGHVLKVFVLCKPILSDLENKRSEPVQVLKRRV